MFARWGPGDSRMGFCVENDRSDGDEFRAGSTKRQSTERASPGASSR